MLPWLALAAAVLVLDQASKAWIRAVFQTGETLELLPFLALVLTYNTGAAFSMLADAAGWQRWFFTAIALGASAFIVHLLRRHPEDRLLCLALALVLGGALGNAIDRVFLGHVTDFVLLHYRGWHWPAFNVADSAITVGAVLLAWDGLRPARPAA